jgi:hypothetical protein
MIAPIVAPVEWWYDLAREVDELGLEGAEGPDVLTSDALLRQDEGPDDEIVRAFEDLEATPA